MSRSALLLFALILSAGAVASSSAQGSCGDWLAHSDDTVLGDTPQTMAAPHTDIDTGIDDGTRWQVTDESHARDSQPRPCRGLHCDQAPLAPLPLPASPINDQRLPDLACLVVLSSANEFEISGGVAESKFGLPAGNQLTIDRPPKV